MKITTIGRSRPRASSTGFKNVSLELARTDQIANNTEVVMPLVLNT